MSTVDAFLVPCLPDVFSLYGIRNIGSSIREWTDQFNIIKSLLSKEKRAQFPAHPVNFLGFTIFNARRYASGSSRWNLARAHQHYADQIPETIRTYMPESVCAGLTSAHLTDPIGNQSVMHSHNTLPAMANKYRIPIWRIPQNPGLEAEDKGTVRGNKEQYESTKSGYEFFAKAVLDRLSVVEGFNG
jgi:hypothetical protein